MIYISSKAYGTLKKLKKYQDSRDLTKEQTYWIPTLHKNQLVDYGFIDTDPHRSLGVYVISKSGKIYIKDHRNKKLCSIAGMLIALSSLEIGRASCRERV